MTTSGGRRTDHETAKPGEPAGDADDEPTPAEHPPLGASAEAAVAALFDAGPEAAEHLLKAAQELLLAAKAVVDAGERAVEAHRAGTDATGPTTAEGPPSSRGRVRHIDLA
ncbi:MAG TPA: hypothetical protein VGO28_00800 [Acidimicrobiia bacterium]